MTELIVHTPGAKIDRPGMYLMDIEEYHGDCCAGPSISSSGLRALFLKSPAHYYDTSYLNPDRAEEEEKEAFILGRAAHHLLLGERDFQQYFVIRPEQAPDGRAWNGNNNSCKEWLKEQKEAGLTVLKPDQIEQIKGMARSLADNPLVQAGILSGEIERSYFWKDPKTGVWLKARPDARPVSSTDYADLKTTTSVDSVSLRRTISQNGYHMQAALVREGHSVLFHEPMSSFSFVFVEKKRPHCSRVVTLKDHVIDLGAKMNRAAIDLFAHCLETGTWPGPGGTQSDAEYVEIWPRDEEEALFHIQRIEQELAAA